MRRVFWFTVGAGVGVFVLIKAREYARKATPAAVQQRVVDSGQGLAARISEFTSTVSQAMAERESELRNTLGLADSDSPINANPLDRDFMDTARPERASER